VLGLMVLALAQPHLGEGFEEVDQRGVDLVVCLDVSRSMRARDMVPDRLGHAQTLLQNLVNQARGDRLALVLFAGDARLVVPLTRDTVAFMQQVKQADVHSVRQGGTHLAAALDVAVEALDGTSGEHEAILLMTDGEDLQGTGLEAAARCRSRGLMVHCVGLGSPVGSKITLVENHRSRFLTDDQGDDVISSMNPATLRRLAEATQGEFVDANQSARPLVDLYRQSIRPMTQKTFESQSLQQRKNRFQWPLAAAMLVLCGSGVRRRRDGTDSTEASS